MVHRKVVNITEVTGMEGEVITMTDIFVFEQAGIENGKVIGQIATNWSSAKIYGKIRGIRNSFTSFCFWHWRTQIN